MSRCRVCKRVVSVLATAAIIASCGGGDDDGGNADATPDSTAPTATEPAATDAASGTDNPPDDAPAATSDESSGDGSSSDGASGSVECDSIFSMAEMEEFFAEPITVTETTDDSLGQLLCTWESIEDPDDLDDLAFQILVVQYYSGSPIEAAAFFDPDLYQSVTTIEGVGDLAFSASDLGTSYYFVDEPVGGSLSYSEVDMGDVDAPKLHTPDDVEQLFRTFHDRVT